MLITLHGVTERFYKGVSAFKGDNGKPLVFFGYTQGHVELKEDLWLEQNMPVSQARESLGIEPARPGMGVV